MRISTVESPFALFQVQIEGVFGNAIELSQVSFRLIPEVLNAIDVIVFRCGKCLAVVDAYVMITFDMQAVVTLECVGVDDAVQ